jgi:AraC-like DNA-binding protein
VRGEATLTATERLPEPGPELDNLALELRSTGTSFARIAKRLGYERTGQAVAAFTRSLRAKPQRERARIRKQEFKRLDAMAVSLRENEALDTETRERRLAVVERLRKALLA